VTSITFAAVIATIMFFCFERTRGFGVIGVFALIAIKPFLFTTLFVFLAIMYLYATQKWRNNHALFK
jgi:hypothetical protein